MKNKVIILLLLVISILIQSCSSYEENHIVLNAQKSKKSRHIGKGVWFEVPYAHYNAKSYDGYRTADRNSSISVKISYSSIEELRKKYSLEYLKGSKIKLLEISTVTYGDNENAFFSVVHDKKRKIIRYLLAIQEGRKIYKIEAYCHYRLQDIYEDDLKKSIFSTYIEEEYVEEKGMFRVAEMDLDKMVMVYTKDGKLPTESLDESMIKVETKEDIIRKDERRLVSRELKKLTGSNKCFIWPQELLNGVFYAGSNVFNGKKGYVVLIVLDKSASILIKCSGNENSNINDFKDFVQDNYLKMVIK